MPEHLEVEQLLDSYALGALTDRDLEDVEAHLDDCPVCTAELSKLGQLTYALRISVPQTEPPAKLREGLMAAAQQRASSGERLTPAPIQLDRARAQHRVPRIPAYWAAAAAIIPLIFSGYLAFQVATLRTSMESVRSEARQAWTHTENVADVMSRGILVGAGTAKMEVTENAPTAGGMLYYLPTQEEGVLIVDGLPRLPQGQCYQVWLISGEKSMNGGTFYLGGDGRGITLINSPTPLSDVDTVRITMEPHGGSEQPRGNRYMWARLKST